MPRPPSTDKAPSDASHSSHRSAAGEVFAGIMNGLADQRYVPGQRLVEVDLAAQFGVSRNSVREALQRLSSEGVVELMRNKGAAIRSLSLQETLEVLDVAERMCGLLARSAAQGVATGHAPNDIEAAMHQLGAADATQDSRAFATARRAWYRALLTASGSRELRRLFPSIQMPIVYAQHRPESLQKVRMRDYRAITRAVLAGKLEAADEAGMAHVRHVREAIVQRLHESGDQRGQ